MNKRVWNTYAERAYTFDCANDQRSAGGIHLYQVKLGSAGWMKRIKQANGSAIAYGKVWPVTPEEGEAAFETARQENW